MHVILATNAYQVSVKCHQMTKIYTTKEYKNESTNAIFLWPIETFIYSQDLRKDLNLGI